MDRILEGLIEFAMLRGSRYVKGRASLEDMPNKMAELGALLLIYSKKINGLTEEDDIRGKLKEIQPYVDEFRRNLYETKSKLVKK